MPLQTIHSVEMMSECSNVAVRPLVFDLSFEHFDVFSVVDKSADRGKLLSIR